jgi:hypothetical protein
MKKLVVFVSFLISLLIVSCSDDAKLMIMANPTAAVLTLPAANTSPVYNAATDRYVLNLDNGTATALTLGYTASDYGQSTAVTYTVQIDSTGSNFANPIAIASVSNSLTMPVTVQQIYNAITNPKSNGGMGIVLTGDRNMSLDVRVMSTIGSSMVPVYSNVKTLKVTLVLAVVDYTQVTTFSPWYIIGLGGNWDNSTNGLGSSLIPLSVIDGKNYLKTGAGTYVYTGYFAAGASFKLVNIIGNWNIQWGNNNTEDINSPVLNNSNSKNFKITNAGYYKVTVNSITNTCTIVPVTVTPASYASLDLPGGYNGWGSGNPMTLNTNTNHTWYATVTFSAETQFKIRKFNDWGTNWGTASSSDGDKAYQTTGIGVSGGKNIYGAVGTFVVLFNDVDGSYWVIKKS